MFIIEQSGSPSASLQRLFFRASKFKTSCLFSNGDKYERANKNLNYYQMIPVVLRFPSGESIHTHNKLFSSKNANSKTTSGIRKLKELKFVAISHWFHHICRYPFIEISIYALSPDPCNVLHPSHLCSCCRYFIHYIHFYKVIYMLFF